jgi:hypothetical protein
MTLQLHKLADGDGETSDRKTEYDDGNAGAHPSEKGPLVREVIASPVRAMVSFRPVFANRSFRHIPSRHHGADRKEQQVASHGKP